MFQKLPSFLFYLNACALPNSFECVAKLILLLFPTLLAIHKSVILSHPGNA